jgi:hypothetical protein
MLVRLTTAVVIASLCAFTAARGWTVVQFARPSTASGAAARAWIGVPAVTAAALDATLRDMADESDAEAAQRRAKLLTALLAVRPMSSVAWLSLAGMQLVTGQPYEKVLAALKMSAITGPNEAAIMWQRGIFELLQWEALPPDFQHRAIVDLSGPLGNDFVNESGVRLIKDVLAAKTPESKAQIAELLATQGVPAKELARIGLETPPSEQ